MRYVHSIEELSDLLQVPLEDLEQMRDMGAPFEKNGTIDFVAWIAWLVIKEGETYDET